MSVFWNQKYSAKNLIICQKYNASVCSSLFSRTAVIHYNKITVIACMLWWCWT